MEHGLNVGLRKTVFAEAMRHTSAISFLAFFPFPVVHFCFHILVYHVVLFYLFNLFSLQQGFMFCFVSFPARL